MNFLETFDLMITTLSPIHVGCGEDYEPTGYVIDEQRLYEFDPVLLMQYLQSDERDEFVRAIDRGLREIQSFFYRNKKKAVEIGRFCAKVNQAAQTFYDSRVGKVAQREHGGGSVLNKLEIARSAHNSISGQPILPGSSLKGAIRTALLESLRQKNYPVATINRKERDIKKDASRQNEQLANDVLGSFETDPLRFLKISDAAFRPKIKVKDKEGHIHEQERHPSICFQINHKKRPNKFVANGKINTLLECIPGFLSNAFFAQCTIEHKATPENGTSAWRPDFSKIASACNDFYLDCFTKENKILRENKYALPWVELMEKRLGNDGMQGKAIASGEGFLLRVGRHSGAESMTVDAPRVIKIMKGRDQAADWEKESTTLWLAAEDKNNPMEKLKPFGWIFVQRKRV